MASAGRSLGVAILGLGKSAIARKLQLQSLTEFLRVKYILDQDVSAAQHLAEKLRVPLSVVGKPTQWDAVCEDASVDAVLICGAPHVNVNMVRRALRHGKDVLVDRPVSLVPTAVMACHEEAQNTDSILMFAFTRRFDRSLQSVKDRIALGQVGVVQSVRISASYSPLPPPDYLRYTGVFRDKVWSEVDLASWLLDESPHTVYATGSANFDVVRDAADLDSVAVSLTYPSGAIAVIDIRRTETTSLNRIEVCGTEGLISVESYTPAVKAHESQTIERLPLTSSDKENFVDTVRHFANVCVGDEEPTTTIEDMLSVSSITQAGEESQRLRAAVTSRGPERTCDPKELLDRPLWKERTNIATDWPFLNPYQTKPIDPQLIHKKYQHK